MTPLTATPETTAGGFKSLLGLSWKLVLILIENSRLE
jgi:hypothetical protein